MKISFIQVASFSLFLAFLFKSCDSQPELYKKEFTAEEKSKLPDQMFENLIRKYGQGSVSEVMVLREIEKIDPENATLWRELGIPYGKRGMAAGFYENYEKSIKYDPLQWQGYLGYMYLYFYRDYKRALTNFNALDTLTPNFVDYPQATSIHFMRAICHLQLEEYDQALSYWDKHFKEELKTLTYEYLDSKSFLFQGITYYKKGDYANAKEIFDLGLKYNEADSDLLLWSAKTSLEIGNFKEATGTIEKADKAFKMGNFNQRPYVEEFYQTYQSDIDEIKEKIKSGEKLTKKD